MSATQVVLAPNDAIKVGKLYIIHQDIKKDLAMYQSDKSLFISIFRGSDSKNFKTKVIGEVKIASPKFDNSSVVDPQSLIKYYVTNPDVSAISFLLNKKYFKGNLEHVRTLKEVMREEGIKKAIFYKEFVITTNQIDQAAGFGFDACLLIYKQLQYVAVEENMSRTQFESYIRDLISYTNSKNIFPVIEVDNIEHMQHVLSMQIDPEQIGIGVNARKLDTPDLVTDRQIHINVYQKFAKELAPYLRFAFSGIEDLAAVSQYDGMYHACLIGTYFSDTFAKMKNQ